MVILSKEVPFVPASAAFMVEHMARSTNFRCGRSVETRVRLSLLSASMGQTAPIQLRNLRPSHSLGFPLDGSELENVAWHRSPADALRASFKQSISCRNALVVIWTAAGISERFTTPRAKMVSLISSIGWAGAAVFEGPRFFAPRILKPRD